MLYQAQDKVRLICLTGNKHGDQIDYCASWERSFENPGENVIFNARKTILNSKRKTTFPHVEMEIEQAKNNTLTIVDMRAYRDVPRMSLKSNSVRLLVFNFKEDETVQLYINAD